jgi:hypothetical protein
MSTVLRVNWPPAQHVKVRTERDQGALCLDGKGCIRRVVGAQKAELAAERNLSQGLGRDRHQDILCANAAGDETLCCTGHARVSQVDPRRPTTGAPAPGGRGSAECRNLHRSALDSPARPPTATPATSSRAWPQIPPNNFGHSRQIEHIRTKGWACRSDGGTFTPVLRSGRFAHLCSSATFFGWAPSP